MDIGDIVIYGGQHLTVRGFDPLGVEPRLIYLEDVETGKTTSVPFAEPSGATRGGAGLRLVNKKKLS